jgi:hypothetical protein
VRRVVIIASLALASMGCLAPAELDEDRRAELAADDDAHDVAWLAPELVPLEEWSTAPAGCEIATAPGDAWLRAEGAPELAVRIDARGHVACVDARAAIRIDLQLGRLVVHSGGTHGDPEPEPMIDPRGGDTRGDPEPEPMIDPRGGSTYGDPEPEPMIGGAWSGAQRTASSESAHRAVHRPLRDPRPAALVAAQGAWGLWMR